MHTTQARVQYQGGVQLIKILALKQKGPEVIYKLTWSQKSPEQSLFPEPKTGRPAVWRSSQSCGCDCWLWACCVRLWPGGRIKQHLRKLLLITAQPVRTYSDTGKQNLITELITVSEFLHHYFFSPMCLCRGGGGNLILNMNQGDAENVLFFHNWTEAGLIVWTKTELVFDLNSSSLWWLCCLFMYLMI